MAQNEHLDVVRRAASGDRDAMATLLLDHQDRIYAVCLRMLGNRTDAEDLTQDVLTTIISHLDQFDGRSALSTWVYRITVNTCLSHLRSARRRRDRNASESDRDAGGQPSGRDGIGSHFYHLSVSPSSRVGLVRDAEPGADSGVEHMERRKQLRAAVGMLEASIRTLLILRDFHGLDHGQISEVMGIPRGTVKSRIFRARMALRRQLERLDGDSGDRVDGASGPNATTDERQDLTDASTAL